MSNIPYEELEDIPKLEFTDEQKAIIRWLNAGAIQSVVVTRTDDYESDTGEYEPVEEDIEPCIYSSLAHLLFEDFLSFYEYRLQASSAIKSLRKELSESYTKMKEMESQIEEFRAFKEKMRGFL